MGNLFSSSVIDEDLGKVREEFSERLKFLFIDKFNVLEIFYRSLSVKYSEEFARYITLPRILKISN